MDIKNKLSILQNLKAGRSNWDTAWQTVAEYVLVRKANFTQTQEAGRFLNTDLFDNTAQWALSIRSSILYSMLWDGGKFKLNPNKDFLTKDSTLVDFFQNASDVLKRELWKAEFDRIAVEAENDEGAFGSSYIFIGENQEQDGLNVLLFQVKESYIEETINGKIDTIYRLYRLGVKQLVDEFGLDNVSDKVKQSFNANRFNEKIEILHVIQPRRNRNGLKEGNRDMRFESVYIEVAQRKMIRESGFRQLPFFVSREGKKVGEKYGRSPSMMAISDIAQINRVREDEIVVENRFADPSLGVFVEAMTTNILNTSPGATNSFKAIGKIGNPIFDMVPTKGDLNSLEVTIVRLTQNISNFYGLDRLLDFNNEREMTLGEAQLRAKMRQQSLSSLLNKKVFEKYMPIIKRSFDILYRQGKFGLVPGDPRIELRALEGREEKIIPETVVNLVASGKRPSDLFMIEFFTPFEIEKKLLENDSYMQVWNNAGLIASLTQDPSVFDNLNADKTIKLISKLSANNDILREDDEVKAIREARATAQQAQQDIENGEQLSVINKNIKESERE